ncbi:putative RNA methylase [Mesorhizobium metallidurans STM 2683]|uniref:site-specific DNA-methyltransferase (adenine-specific) n=1 Tax=Mesorhizobium metallidurans STM 2683 TaxID=1297569 RepID=M5EJP6_9HYPH|nr:putative RNA methylase [Mesorhizobium metallidurans STM 2683]
MGEVSQIRLSELRATSPSVVDGCTLRFARGELSKARLLARAWSETIDECDRETYAVSLTRHALEALSRSIGVSPALCPSLAFDTEQLDEPASALANTIGETAGRLPILEALHLVTSLYPILLPTKERGERGAFYTPPALVNRLLDQAEEEGLDWRTARVLDPAAGGGTFLFHAAHRMIAALGECEPAFALSHVGTRLAGFELDPHAAMLAQGALEIALAEVATKAGRAAPTIVTACSTLEAEPEPVFDLVVGNPPYGRVSLLPELRERYARSLYGHANLYGVFTDAALRWTKRGGLVAFLTPTSFLGGHYYSALRSLLAREAPPVAIDFVHARRGVFEDVLQETLLAVYKRGAQPQRAQIHYLTVASETEAKVTRNGTIGLPSDRTAPWLAPRTPEHSRLIARAETMMHRLADWGYEVSTGPLVWNRFKDQLRDRAGGEGVHPLIWAESVTFDGQFTYRAYKKNHAPYFKLEVGDDWLLVEEPCVLVQRTTAKEQARRLIAAELPEEFIDTYGGVVVENHLNMVRAIGSTKVPAAVLAALLNSRVVDDLFRCISGSVAVSAFELEALPLPSPECTKALTKLVTARATRERIQVECDRLYGEFT